MFQLVDIVDGKTGFLRRTAAAAVSPTGDDWYLQRHNFMKWPMKVMPDTESNGVEKGPPIAME